MERDEGTGGAAATRRTRSARWVRLAALGFGAIGALAAALFVFEGTREDWRTPEFAVEPGAVREPPIDELRVLAFNVAKAEFRRGGSFADVERVERELDELVHAIEAERADVVCLSEVVLECGPAPLDQVEYVTRAAKLPFRAASANYSFGWPFFRIRSGNAVLSRVPLRALETVQLAGAKPFWNPTNNRRALFCELELGGEVVLVGSLRNDSYDLATNAVQTREILDWLGGRSAVLAGDFNAEPHDESFGILAASGRFTGFADGPPTFPSSAPRRRIDHVLAPASWTLVEQHVVRIGNSDHLAVAATFRVR